MFYRFKIHKENDGYWAECVELKGCATQADSLEELEKNMKESLNLFLDEPADSKAIFPFPKSKVKGRAKKIQVEPSIALAFQLRMMRLKRKMTQKEAAQKLGMKNLFSYQRLESSKTANPALQTLSKLKKVFPELSLDAVI